MKRPKGFKNPYKEDLPMLVVVQWNNGKEIRLCPEIIFEAGADEMLKALLKIAEESPTKEFSFDSHFYRASGGLM